MATGIIVNPNWTLPRSIINEGIGATIANNPASARRQGYTWTGSGKNLSVVQLPGANNALGVTKMEMLNEHAIYLPDTRSEEPTSELQSLKRISYAVFCLNKQNHPQQTP